METDRGGSTNRDSGTRRGQSCTDGAIDGMINRKTGPNKRQRDIYKLSSGKCPKRRQGAKLASSSVSSVLPFLIDIKAFISPLESALLRFLKKAKSNISTRGRRVQKALLGGSGSGIESRTVGGHR